MTQVSQYGGLDMINGDDIQVDDLSDISDDNREDEIKKVLEGIGNETFDYDSDDSSLLGSRSSSVNHNNNNSIFSNKDVSHVKSRINGIENNSILNGMNMSMLPNIVTDGTENNMFPQNINSPRVTESYDTAFNLQTSIKGNLNHGDVNVKRSKKHVTIVDRMQKNREDEEIEESNPTISLLHKDHCPRSEKGINGTSDMWLAAAAENKEEQMKTLLEIRERQVHRNEEEVAKLQKDKRSLNHQIGLMKTEMVQMKSQQNDAEKFARLKEQECEYLKTKLREAIEEYEKAKKKELTAQDGVSLLNSENERLKQEIQLLSSIGSSTQQAEISDVVRQLREKHAADFVSWKKVVTELEGQLRTYKRQQQLMMEESFVGTKINASSQTDEILSDFRNCSQANEIKRKERTQIAILQDADDGDVLIKEKKIISLNEKFEELKRDFVEEKAQLVNSYENEIEQYRLRLATLPNELYHLWEKTQQELGLKTDFESRPICVDAFTSPIEITTESSSDSRGFDSKLKANHEPVDAAVQVNFASLMANRDHDLQQNKDLTSDSSRNVSSILVQTEDKETSHAVIQTDETLETYKILAQLLESWSNEVQISKANEEEMTLKCRESEEQLNKLQKQFKLLQKVATKCRKESKRREEAFKRQNADMKGRHLEVLQKLGEKLDILA